MLLQLVHLCVVDLVDSIDERVFTQLEVPLHVRLLLEFLTRRVCFVCVVCTLWQLQVTAQLGLVQLALVLFVEPEALLVDGHVKVLWFLYLREGVPNVHAHFLELLVIEFGQLDLKFVLD